MSNAGSALMGIGSARGEDRARAAAETAVSSPLLEASIEGAHGVLLSIAGGSDLGLFEVSAAANLIQGSAHEDANIIFGTVIDDALGRRGSGNRYRSGLRGRPAAAPPTRHQQGRRPACQPGPASAATAGAGTRRRRLEQQPLHQQRVASGRLRRRRLSRRRYRSLLPESRYRVGLPTKMI